MLSFPKIRPAFFFSLALIFFLDGALHFFSELGCELKRFLVKTLTLGPFACFDLFTLHTFFLFDFFMIFVLASSGRNSVGEIGVLRVLYFPSFFFKRKTNMNKDLK